MKKTYIEPQLESVKINAVSLLSGSLKGDGLQISIGGSATGDAEGRGSDEDW